MFWKWDYKFSFRYFEIEFFLVLDNKKEKIKASDYNRERKLGLKRNVVE